MTSKPGLTAVSYRSARPEDREAVLRVLKFANMHNVPSPEMPEFGLR